jgi:hypothetical protein
MLFLKANLLSMAHLTILGTSIHRDIVHAAEDNNDIFVASVIILVISGEARASWLSHSCLTANPMQLMLFTPKKFISILSVIEWFRIIIRLSAIELGIYDLSKPTDLHASERHRL